MTRAEAEQRAAEKTARGVLTRARRNASRAGGYQTVTLASVRAATARFLAKPEGLASARASQRKYRESEAGRASQTRSWLGRTRGKDRLSWRGERFNDTDLLALHALQRGKCFVCGVDLSRAGTFRNGQKNAAVEHHHGSELVRSLTHQVPCNVLLGAVEKALAIMHGIPPHARLDVLFGRVRGALAMPWVVLTDEEERRLKRQLKKGA